MKFYVHYEASPEFTLAVHWSDTDSRTVAELRGQFATAFKAAHGQALPQEAQLSAAEGEPQLPHGACVAHIVSDGGDLFAVCGAAPPVVTSAAASSASNGSKEAAKALVSFLKAAEKAWEKKEYRKARALYREFLEKSEASGALQLPSVNLGIALRRLGELETLNKRPEAGQPFLERAERAAPTEPQVQLALADCLEAQGEYQEAVERIQAALRLVPENKESKKVTKQRKRISIKLGKMFFEHGDRKTGGQVLTQLLQEDMDDPDALLGYGEAALALGQVGRPRPSVRPSA